MKKFYSVTFLIATLLLSSACTKPRFSAIGRTEAINDPVFGEEDGTTGSTGTNGDYIPGEEDGTTGDTGANGATGATGTTGANGTTGATGDNGDYIPGEEDGDNGDNGATNGSTGTNGATNGTTGDNGTVGTNGATNGTTGDNGSVGTNGSTNGTTGDNGSVGTNGSTNGATGDNGANNGTVGDNGGNGANGDIGTPGENDEPKNIPVDLLCSNSRTARVGYNLKSAVNLEVQVIDNNGNIICRNNASNVRAMIINDHVLPVNVCAEATGLSYRLRLVDLSKPNNNKIDKNSDGSIRKMNDLLNYNTDQSPMIVRKSTADVFEGRYNVNSNRVIEVLYAGNQGSQGSDPLCDRRASPLIIKTDANDHTGIQLTSQKNGILFDILGENSNPRAHAKKQISWITKDTYMFLVKPNANGRVNGINEMFGDNTKGPDGDFADDGYDALKKFDKNLDNVIDQNDAVYAQLKLWSDKNFDGKAQKDELISLKDAGIEAIDLMYDDSFNEVDQFGNQTKMKSVVKYSDGSLRLIFDLWFNYQGKRQNHRR